MFKRLQRWTGGEAVEVDTQVLAGVVRPGDTFPGQVVLKVELRTLLGDEDSEDSQDGADNDLIHVSSLPLHDAWRPAAEVEQAGP